MRRVALLLGKDLRILGRSRALVVAFVTYPLLVAALVGLVVRFAGDRPRVAFVDLDNLPKVLEIGGQRFNVANVLDEIGTRVELVPMSQRDARRKLDTGEILAAIIVPRGFAAKLRGMVESPRLILETTRGGIGGSIEQQMEALVFNLNQRLQEAYIKTNLGYVQLLLKGGKGEFLGNEFDIIGLEAAARALGDLERRTADPEARKEIEKLVIFVREATLAVGQTGTAMRAVANPIKLTEAGGGRSYLFSATVQAHAVALTLAFLCVLLAAAALASERDENVVARLTRGLVRLTELVAEKIALVTAVAVALGVALVVVFGLAVEIAGAPGGQPWQRLPLFALGLVLAGIAFGAFGTLLGVVAREGRTASLLAFLVVLPVVLVSLIPRSSGETAYWIGQLFPFAHGVSFFESALYDLDPWGRLAREAAWLACLAAVFGAASRAGVRRLVR